MEIILSNSSQPTQRHVINEGVTSLKLIRSKEFVD